MDGKSTRSALSLPDPDPDHFFCCLTTHTTRATTTTSIKIGIHIPPYPPIQPPPHAQPFIMFPLCAKATPVANKGTVPTAIANKFFTIFPIETKKLAVSSEIARQPKIVVLPGESGRCQPSACNTVSRYIRCCRLKCGLTVAALWEKGFEASEFDIKLRSNG